MDKELDRQLADALYALNRLLVAESRPGGLSDHMDDAKVRVLVQARNIIAEVRGV